MRSVRDLNSLYNPTIRHTTKIINNNALRLNPTNKYLGGKCELIYKELLVLFENISGNVNQKDKVRSQRDQYHTLSEAVSFRAGNNKGS